MTFVAQIIFWSSAAALFYTYAGYPLLVWLLSRMKPREIKRAAIEPQVSVIITAYNEERDLRAKLENTLDIDYPKEKLEIIVASDGSTDGTDGIAEGFASRNVRLVRREGRIGKTRMQNEAVEQAAGEILLFSDATTMYQPNVLREMLPNFSDETVGCVAGKLIYVDSQETNVGAGAKGYWNYETFIKESESRACSLIGASGCLYAVRKSAYQPMYAEACSDFLIATVIYKQNLRTIYEPNAVCTEETNRESDKEFKMRVRIITQTYNDLWRNREMLNPFKNGFYAVELISHKLFRYAVSLFIVTLLLSSAILAAGSKLFAAILIIQILFYLLALISSIVEKNGLKLGFLAMPHYFILANSASVIAFYKFLRGERFARWEPIRENIEKENQSV